MSDTPLPVRGRSLRWLLLSTVCIAAALGLALSGVLSYREAQHEAEELMDGHLAQSARLLLALVSGNENHFGDLAARLATVSAGNARLYEPPLSFQIGRADGSLLMRSENAPAAPLSTVAGYSVVEHPGHSWRMLNLATATGEYRVQVGQSVKLRDRAALKVAKQAVFPIALISPLLLLSIYYSVRRALKPLDALAAEVTSRSPDNLVPLNVHRVPLEAQPLLAALNRLLFRLRHTLANERRFTADAAHELRTPLAVVRIQAQVAQLTADPEDRRHALTQVLAGADRATRVIEQLLRLARLDPLAGLPNPGDVDLVALARRVLADAPSAAGGRHIGLQVRTLPLSIGGDAELIGIALRNLLDNALRYTPVDSPVVVVVDRQNGDVLLGVVDKGPGVAPDELPRLVERFFRGSEAGAEGGGLGLAIVQRIAELHHARLEVENRSGGGLAAFLRWRGAP